MVLFSMPFKKLPWFEAQYFAGTDLVLKSGFMSFWFFKVNFLGSLLDVAKALWLNTMPHVK